MIQTSLLPNKKSLLSENDIKVNEFYKSKDNILYYVSKFYRDNQRDDVNTIYTVSEINYSNYNVVLYNKKAVANYLNERKAKLINVLIKEVSE